MIKDCNLDEGVEVWSNSPNPRQQSNADRALFMLLRLLFGEITAGRPKQIE